MESGFFFGCLFVVRLTLKIVLSVYEDVNFLICESIGRCWRGFYCCEWCACLLKEIWLTTPFYTFSYMPMVQNVCTVVEIFQKKILLLIFFYLFVNLKFRKLFWVFWLIIDFCT